MATKQRTPAEALRKYLRPGPDCWSWDGAHLRGYAAVWLGGRAGNYRPAHRVFYELIHGPVSDALQVDHLCGNRGCVNPDHLEAVTPSVNTMRAKRKMFCVNGHRLAGDNIYVRKDRQNARECRTCRSGGRSQ